MEASAEDLKSFQGVQLLSSSEDDYAEAVSSLLPSYRRLRLSASGATTVVHSRALYLVLPDLIPPIDRQYTVRFFSQPPDRWRDCKGKFRPAMLPSGFDAQFRLFQSTCIKVKHLADRVDRALLEKERREHGVTPSKAIANAIANYVRIVSGLASRRSNRRVDEATIESKHQSPSAAGDQADTRLLHSSR